MSNGPFDPAVFDPNVFDCGTVVIIIVVQDKSANQNIIASSIAIGPSSKINVGDKSIPSSIVIKVSDSVGT